MISWFTGLGLWIRLGIFAGIVGLFALAIWYVHHSIYTSGYTAAETKLQPQIDELKVKLTTKEKELTDAVKINQTFQAELGRLSVIVRDQNAAASKLQAEAIEAQNRAREALARVAANQKRYTAEIARLQSIVNGPPMTEGDCDEADSIMRSILRDRMSITTGAAEADHSGSAEGGGGQSHGAAAMHQTRGSAPGASANEDRFEEGGQSAGERSGGDRLARAR